jgi:hypothetical protein
VVLASALASLLGTSGNAGISAAYVRPGTPAIIAPKIAHAFGQTFQWAAGLLSAAEPRAVPACPDPERVTDAWRPQQQMDHAPHTLTCDSVSLPLARLRRGS